MGAALGRLRKRCEFLAVAATNRRWTSPGVVLQARKFSADDAPPAEPGLRVGFTATRKVGNAVARNRAKRRLRAAVRDVIGHNESLRSPYHHERVARLRTQTHGDWTHADMRRYRAKL